MRSPLLLLILALSPLGAGAQTTQKERSLYERIMKPDETKAFDPSTGAFGSRSFSAGPARTKDFQFEQRFSPKPFQSKEFTGAKSAPQADFKFATTEARTKVFSDGSKTAAVKEAPTKEAREAGKSAPTRALPDGQRQYLGPESKKLGKAIDPNAPPQGWTGSLQPLSIEDIRELLNKNK